MFPIDHSRPYDTHELLARLLDGSEFDEYKATYGQRHWSAAPAGSRAGRWASWPTSDPSSAAKDGHRSQDDRELQIGGVIYSDSADKGPASSSSATRRGSRLVFLQDVTGFMVGSRAEQRRHHQGRREDGQRGRQLGGAQDHAVRRQLLRGRQLRHVWQGLRSPDFFYAWPSAAIAVMGGEQASKTLLAIQLKGRGEDVWEEEKTELLARIQTPLPRRRPILAMPHARLWVDAIIDPKETRQILARSLTCAAQNPQIDDFKTGVLQT